MFQCWYAVLFCIVFGMPPNDDLITKTSVVIDENSKLLIFGSRHGNRYPGKFLKDNPRFWGYEGDYELTQFGKREGFGFGKELREFVGGLINNNYMRDEVAFYTSSANRCQMTLQVIMAGLYPPDTFGEWNHALEWSPVPYTIDDPMLRTYSIPNCTAIQRAWEPIAHDNLPELAQMTASNLPLLEYIAQNTGWNKSIESASDLADNIFLINLYNTGLPDWIERPTLEGYDKQSLQEAIMMFMEKHTLTCVNYEPCRDIMGGVWLNHILTALRKIADGQKSQKILGYVSHLETTLSVMKLLKINQTYLNTTSGFLIEYRDQPKKSVRLLTHETLTIDKHIIEQANYMEELEAISDSSHWIPFEEFYKVTKSKVIVDWMEACGRKETLCKTPEDGNMLATSNITTSDQSDNLADNHVTFSASCSNYFDYNHLCLLIVFLLTVYSTHDFFT
ncbi:unnamed protein product [Thelazia callipaeda]|uniref:Histidine acid phosphatase n=1 Tax=Thelazia callipaeda TaxID=103827 RepID=A0A0N5D4Y8_THECL|nr:unnamed protein product [Thelazia callipaeda]